MQQPCVCEPTAAQLALPALCLIVAAEEDIHLPVAHSPVGHWHNVLLQAGALWVDMLPHASLQPEATSHETSGLRVSLQQAVCPRPKRHWPGAAHSFAAIRLRPNLHAPPTGLAWGQQCIGPLVQEVD